MRARSRVALSLAVVAATTGLATPAASAGGDVAVAATCGFYKTVDAQYYNHCGPTNVRIHVDIVFASDGVWCVAPGVTRLGPKPTVRDAWYVGLC
ncbi:DUF6355 family natural product biosynthesis protein [Allokutzneria oryzae]|uniref:DUF6355 family natural product biosynthesis protein n=1 Tax=Allokutzneria oryzae TaxID=1378989 RepID=A0ABV6A3T2_9PSEU